MFTYTPFIYAALITLAYGLWVLWCLRGSKGGAAVISAHTLVAYASSGGQAERLAKQLKLQLEAQGLVPSVGLAQLNQVKAETLHNTEQLLLVASTYGEGEAPDNGRLFLPRLRKLAANELHHLKFAVLALGDKSYQQYCQFGVAAAHALSDKGAQAFFEPVKVDCLNQEDLLAWQQQLQQHGLLSYVQAVADVQQAPRFEAALLERLHLNAGSPGDAIWQLGFAAPEGVFWQAGDIVKLQILQQEREYTIASLPQENVLRLLVRERLNGLGSSFLCQQLALGQKASFKLRENQAFHAPAANAPLILIGNGTGLSGLRAHLKQREQQQISNENWLIYGERSPVYDLPWHQELLDWQACKHLTQLDFTFSRTQNCQWPEAENGQNCRCYAGYVQEVLHNQQQQLKEWLARGAVIYLCGSKEGMAQDVEQQLQQILGEQELDELIEQGRFKRDVY